MADQAGNGHHRKDQGACRARMAKKSPSTRNLTALGIHSLELTEIIFDLEEAYGIEIEMNTVEAWSNLKNVGDMVEAVRALIAKKA